MIILNRKHVIKICPHIKIKGEKAKKGFCYPEYEQKLELLCKVCDKTYTIIIAVN
jgi:hypothetical protein